MRAERCLPALLVLLFLLGALFAVYYDRGPAGIITEHAETLSDEEKELFTETFSYLDFRSGNLDGYTAAEQSHLADVRLLLLIGLTLFVATAITTTLIIFYSKKEKVARSFLLSGIIVLVLALLLGASAFFDFTTFWNWFHHILFPQGNWQFAAESLLIQLFTEQFFMQCATHYVLALASFGIVAVLVSWMGKKN